MSGVGGALVAMGVFSNKSRPKKEWTWFDSEKYFLEIKQELENSFKNLDISPEEFSKKYDKYESWYLFNTSSFKWNKYRPICKVSNSKEKAKC